jgi:hypothetical protein
MLTRPYRGTGFFKVPAAHETAHGPEWSARFCGRLDLVHLWCAIMSTETWVMNRSGAAPCQ